jgi:hypothetical protein
VIPPKSGYTVTVDEELGDDWPIWQYLTLSKFISMLENGGPWFSRMDRFADIHEMAISRSALDLSVNEMADYIYRQTGEIVEHRIARALADLVEAQMTIELRANYLASCWHMSEVESGAMWAIYGHEGVAISTTIRSLANSLSSTGHTIEIFPVIYVDHATDELPRDEPYRFKHRLYAYEQELRALLTPPSMEKSPAGFPVPVALPELIHSIHVPPGSHPMHQSVVSTILNRFRLPNIPIETSAADTIPQYRQGVHNMLQRLDRESFRGIFDEISHQVRQQPSAEGD